MDFNPYVTMKSYAEVILLQYKKCPQDGSQMGIKSIDGKKNAKIKQRCEVFF